MTSGVQWVLEATDLAIDHTTPEGCVRSLDGASLRVGAGEITAVVGESGSGKTTLGLAIGRLLAGNATHAGGDLVVLGERVLHCDTATLRALRQEGLGFIFQDPVAALNPTLRIGRQMQLAAGGGDIESFAEALVAVGLTDASRVLRAHPHQLSGGMAQRVGIAMALIRSPRLLIADEPTAAVDATRRSQILELLVERCRATACALLLLTHDLSSVARWCSHVAVMYGGRVVENGTTADVLDDPWHPYTRALITALPGKEGPQERLSAIGGVPPVLRGPSEGCAFAARCPAALERCTTARPASLRISDRSVCCHLFSEARCDELAQSGAGPVGAANGSLRRREEAARHTTQSQAGLPDPTQAKAARAWS